MARPPIHSLLALLASALVCLCSPVQSRQFTDFTAYEDDPHSQNTVHHHNVSVHERNLRIVAPYAHKKGYFYVLRDDEAKTVYFVDDSEHTYADLTPWFSEFHAQLFLERPEHPDDACQDWLFEKCERVGSDVDGRRLAVYKVGDLSLWVDVDVDAVVKRARSGVADSVVTNIQEGPVPRRDFELPSDLKPMKEDTAITYICDSLPAFCPVPPQVPAPPQTAPTPGIESQPQDITPIQDAPARVWLRPRKASAMPGEKIPIEVDVANKAAIPVFADRNYDVSLDAEKAEITPTHLTIAEGTSRAIALFSSSTPGRVRVRAYAAGLEEATGMVCVCGTGQVGDIDLDTYGERASPGERIQFSVVVTDGNGNCVTDHSSKNIAMDVAGVGKLQFGKPPFVPRDGCVVGQELFSSQPGKALVTARLGSHMKQKTFLFILPLSLAVILLSLLGGTAGAFVQAASAFARSRRWSGLRWTSSLVVGAILGLFFFLVCYHGLLSTVAPTLAGKTISFVLGFLAGFAGPPIVGFIARQFGVALPTTPPQAGSETARIP